MRLHKQYYSIVYKAKPHCLQKYVDVQINRIDEIEYLLYPVYQSIVWTNIVSIFERCSERVRANQINSQIAYQVR